MSDLIPWLWFAAFVLGMFVLLLACIFAVKLMNGDFE